MEDQSGNSAWHLDRRVPIALIASLAFQTALGVWWASQITSDANATRERVTRLELNEADDRKELRATSGSIHEIKAQIAELLRGVQRVENTLTRRESPQR